MKQNRRQFIKRSSIASLGVLIIPKFLYANNDNKRKLIIPKPDITKWKDNEINIAWIGHSTMLINFYGTIILTDPVLLKRIGLKIAGLTFGPGRIIPPALKIDELPKPDIILLSHAHFDHTDYPTLKTLTEKFHNEINVITAKQTKDVIYDLEWKSITVLDWRETVKIADTNITAIETKHFGWRFPGEKDRSRGYKNGRSYNAYLIEKKGKNILFAGDTAMTDKYQIVKNKKIDITIMPIGAYNPWNNVHCNPEEALTMAENLGAKYFIPMHCKTFRLGAEPYNEPVEWLNKSVKNYKLTLGLNSIGETFTL